MNLSAPLVGAYVCPRGVFAIVCKRRDDSLSVERTFEVPAMLESAYQAGDHLVGVLRSAGLRRARVVLVVRGFGVVHHVLQMPPARDDMLTPIIEREFRRLEPQLGEAAVSWTGLPTLDSGLPEAPSAPQRSLLAAAVATDVVDIFEERLQAEGHRLQHLTALPAAMQRLLEEFDTGEGPNALVAQLPDGAFLGFALSGAIRLVVEPPLSQEQDVAALGEELELGTMFVRQQFRGAQIERITLAGSKDVLGGAASALADRLHVPTAVLDMQSLSPAALAALGGVIDANSAKPLAMGGAVRERIAAGPRSAVASAAIAAVALLAALGLWNIVEMVRARQASDALRATRRNIERESFALASQRSTADQRKLMRDAMTALHFVSSDRMELQQTLTGIADAIRRPVEIDSLQMSLTPTGWKTIVIGRALGATNARAILALNDAYGGLPQRLSVDSLHLDELSYPDSSADDVARVRYQISFALPSPRRN